MSTRLRDSQTEHETSEGVYKIVYEPETLQMMGAAFDRAWRFLSPKVAASEMNRRKLALRIILHVDGGENHQTRLAALAITDFLRYPG